MKQNEKSDQFVKVQLAANLKDDLQSAGQEIVTFNNFKMKLHFLII